MISPYRTPPTPLARAPKASRTRLFRAWWRGVFGQIAVRRERHRLARQFPNATWKTRMSTAVALCGTDHDSMVDASWGMFECQYEHERLSGFDPT